MPKAPLNWIVTANFTADGSVAYLAADQTFSRNVADVVVFAIKDDAEAARKLALGREAIVSDPYLTEVSDADGDAGERLDVRSTRERIRAKGPTVPYGRAPKTSAFQA
jgi:hypothetical protein